MSKTLSPIRSGFLVYLSLGLLISVFSVNPVCGQHYLARGDEAPGLAAQKRLMANPRLAGFVQPVKILTPQGSLVSMWSSQGFGVADNAELNVGLTIGQVFRVKVSNIHRNFDREVYPSIEILDRLYPPAGMKNKFPIQIVITQDDLEKAIQGRMVTKVIYLEDGDVALPYRPMRDNQPYFDISQSEDVLRTAGRMGRPMAIVRIGSRIPTFDDMTTGEFDFQSSTVFEVPPTPAPRNENEIYGDVDVGQLVPRVPAPNVPPVVPANQYRGRISR